MDIEVLKTGTGLWFLTGHESQQSSGLSAWGPDQNFLDLNSDWRSWCYQIDTLVSSGGYGTEESTSHCHLTSPLLFSKQNACLQMQLVGDSPGSQESPTSLAARSSHQGLPRQYSATPFITDGGRLSGPSHPQFLHLKSGNFGKDEIMSCGNHLM